VLITTIFVPIVIVFCNSKAIMVELLGQNSVAAEECQRYLTMILPALYIDSIFDSFEIFLTAMEKSYLPMVIQIVSIPLHVFWCYLFT
jgi:Na+-driven multidrug efflux pump